MKYFIIACFLLLSFYSSNGQDTKFSLYNPEADANSQLDSAISLAQINNKHVFVQIGGNWCKWCRMFYKWSNETASVDSLIKADYIVVHMNYSKENKNEEQLKAFAFPQRFGFPVFVILDNNGNKIHTQSTGYLEDGEGYSEKKVVEFLKQWNMGALNESNYLD